MSSSKMNGFVQLKIAGSNDPALMVLWVLMGIVLVLMETIMVSTGV